MAECTPNTIDCGMLYGECFRKDCPKMEDLSSIELAYLDPEYDPNDYERHADDLAEERAIRRWEEQRQG